MNNAARLTGNSEAKHGAASGLAHSKAVPLSTSAGLGAEETAAAFSSSRFGSYNPNSHAPLDPTGEAYAYWSWAFTFWNLRLFNGQLPNVILTFARKTRVLGYFKPAAMENRAGAIAHQIALNPAYFEPWGDAEAHSTLVHEMAHLWRYEFGPTGRNGSRGARGYHCRYWADKMSEIGLEPSDTGMPGGNRTGHRVSHYMRGDGPFVRVFREIAIAGEAAIEWRDHVGGANGGSEAADDGIGGATSASKKTSKADRLKFTCPSCGLNAWAKPSARIDCHNCRVLMLPKGVAAPGGVSSVSGSYDPMSNAAPGLQILSHPNTGGADAY